MCRAASRHGFLASFLLVGGLLSAPLASASGVAPTEATTVQKTEAMEHFLAGKRALGSQDLDMAILELRASLEIVDSPNARLELARALRDDGKLVEAWTEFGRVLADAARLAGKEQRYMKTAEAATGERVELESKLAFVLGSVTHAPADAALRVGGRTIPPNEWSAPIATSPGTVDVVLATGGDKELARQTLTLSAGEKKAVTLDGQPVAETPAPTATIDSTIDREKVDEPGSPRSGPPEPTPASGGMNLRPYAYVAGGVGVVGLAAFATFGLMSNATYSALQGACHPGCPPDKRSEIDSGRSQQTIANVGLAVGLVGAAAGATLWVVSMGPKSSNGSAALLVGPAYVGIKGSL
jgi:hypothetical protein